MTKLQNCPATTNAFLLGETNAFFGLYLISAVIAIIIINIIFFQLEAGVTFDNSFFDNSFVLVRQLKNRSFLGPVFVHVTGQNKN
jgi:hypothetical protein